MDISVWDWFSHLQSIYFSMFRNPEQKACEQPLSNALYYCRAPFNKNKQINNINKKQFFLNMHIHQDQNLSTKLKWGGKNAAGNFVGQNNYLHLILTSSMSDIHAILLLALHVKQANFQSTCVGFTTDTDVRRTPLFIRFSLLTQTKLNIWLKERPYHCFQISLYDLTELHLPALEIPSTSWRQYWRLDLWLPA